MIIPKKEVLYAPMLGTLGGGSARGFGRGGGGGNLYDFTSYTFEETVRGTDGNAWSVFQSRYSGQAFYDDGYIEQGEYTGYQRLTLPADGTYEFEIAGAPGTSTGQYHGGRGYIFKGRMDFSAGSRIQFVVGKAGGSPADNVGGGGGGTFVVKDAFFDGGGQINSNIIGVAGGGAGGAYNSSPAFDANSGTGGVDGQNNPGSGGSNGNGGNGNNLSGNSGAAGPAAGIYSAGTNFTYNDNATQAQSFAAGAVGSEGYYRPSGQPSGPGHPSGFGCAGPGGNYAGGPGGGYSGGGGGSGNGYKSGGGGSYYANLNNVAFVGYRGTGQESNPSAGGYVKITFIG